MKQSLSYYLTLFVIKLKGIKSNFSKDPIDYKKIRKEDVHEPKGNFFKNHISNRIEVLDSIVTEIVVDKNSTKLLIFIHGGAFISGPAQHHWDALKTIAQATNFTSWLCNYPKAPENNITAISKNIDAIYIKALEKYTPSNIFLIGDSVGATLVTCLVQRLIEHKNKLPKKIILVSPVMDASLSNQSIEKIEEKDPMLSKKGVLSAKKMCAGDKDLKDQLISPLYASFQGFPSTVLFIAQNDIMYPDEKLAVEKLNEANVDLELIEGKNMPHIWPFLPVMKESRIAMKKIIAALETEDSKTG